MMKHVSILILIFLACLFAGCADEPIDSPEGLPEKGADKARLLYSVS